MSDHDLDELHVLHDETVSAALDVAARVAELTINGPYDTATVAFKYGLAASLQEILKRERQLRRAIKAEVAG